MTALQLLTRADAADLERLGVYDTIAIRIDGAKFDNRPTWDNTKPRFDNRPSWDNWNKKK